MAIRCEEVRIRIQKQIPRQLRCRKINQHTSEQLSLPIPMTVKQNREHKFEKSKAEIESLKLRKNSEIFKFFAQKICYNRLSSIINAFFASELFIFYNR